MTHASAVLRDVFGFDEFRPGQKDIVDAVTQGENVLAIMPTGGGKSLCYQLPALLRDGVTIVVSPLIALMRDQVRALRSIGVGAGALTSANTQEENDEIFAGLEDGSLRLLYLAPERLGSAQIMSVLRRYRVGMISVDEAHCVSQWGHDFRPDYKLLTKIEKKKPWPNGFKNYKMIIDKKSYTFQLQEGISNCMMAIDMMIASKSSVHIGL